MKTYAMVGFILIVVGISAFVYQGVTFATSEEVADPAQMQPTVERTKAIPLPPIVGGLGLAGGLVLLLAGGKREPRKASKRPYGRWLL